MPRRAAGLNARKVETLGRPGRHADGLGLYLVVKCSGKKSWSLLYTHSGRRREKGLGGYPAVSLAAARKLALKERERLALGEDPLSRRIAAPRFGELADEYIKIHQSGWRNAKHRAQWAMTLSRYAAPLRDKRVNEIEVADIVNVLAPIWTTKPETASRLRGRLEAVLDAAKARGHRDGENPAAWRGNLKHLLPRRARLTRGHHAAMPYVQLPEFMADLASRTGTAARALEFIILTAARVGEAVGARWGEINLDSALWTVPAHRMKAGREHRVPLSPQAFTIIELMAAQRRSDGPEALLFPGHRGDQALSGMSTAMLLRRMECGEVTTHGFRSSFRDWAAECTNFPREIAEAALAHRVGDAVERAYRRGDALEKRRELMSLCGSYLLKVGQTSIKVGMQRAAAESTVDLRDAKAA
jgi:integrase